MPNLLIARSKRAALAASFLIPFAGGALAQTADDRRTAALEKEVSALRAKVHRLELEKEVGSLHAKIDQLQGRRPVQATTTDSVQGAPQQLVTRIQTNSPDRTLVMADMPMKAAPPPVAYYSWTGFYFGGNIGYSVGIDRTQMTYNLFEQPPQFSSTAADAAVTPSGAIGGVQFGYNWQGGANWLVGFEADFQASAQKTTGCLLACLTFPGGSPTTTFASTQSLDYFGTVRGRFGFVDRGNLFYVTGGGAYGHVNQSLDFHEAGSNFNFQATAATSENKFGWVVGAGAESSLGGNWTARVEYLYMNLGNVQTALNGVLPAAAAGINVPAPPFTQSATTSLHDNIVRAGLNYRFGPPAGTVSAYDAMAAVPPPIYSWTGFYVGANVGYGFGNDHNQTDISSVAFGGSLTSEPGSSITPRGGLGGVQLGYNWQAAPRWIVGFEADLQGTAQRDTACGSIACLSDASDSSQNTSVTVQHQLDYFGTLRGRIGFLHNNTLFYGTGGGAFGHVQDSMHFVFGDTQTDRTITKDLFGYTVGGGIEAMLGGGWSAKAEYLYLNLGSISNSADVNVGGTTVTAISNSTVRDHIVRIGANYHIGAAPY